MVTPTIRKKRIVPSTGSQAAANITEYEEEIMEEERAKTLTSYRKDKARGEDVEHYFEAFHDSRLEMSDEWDKASTFKTTTQCISLKRLSKMLDGVANKT